MSDFEPPPPHSLPPEPPADPASAEASTPMPEPTAPRKAWRSWVAAGAAAAVVAGGAAIVIGRSSSDSGNNSAAAATQTPATGNGSTGNGSTQGGGQGAPGGRGTRGTIATIDGGSLTVSATSQDGTTSTVNVTTTDATTYTETVAGQLSDVATLLPGTPPHRPNDLCFGPDGLLYFTDPHDWENLPAIGVGRVNRTSLDGDVELLCDFPNFPNGIAFGPDDRLYVAQSMTQQVLVMEPRPGDTPRPFFKLPEGFPDGFCFDRTGRLYCAGSLGDVLVVFEPDGRVAQVIEMGKGSEPTNCCIGDGRLYATLSGPGELVALDLAVEALPLYPARR